MRVAVVVSFLDEEERLPGLLASMDRQDHRPAELVLVDDGSTDRSGDIAAEFCRDRSWATLLRRPRRPPATDRLAGAFELRSFQWAVDRLQDGWEVVGKVDADMVLTPSTLAAVVARFAGDPGLGMCGPFIAEPDRSGRAARKACGPGHVEGSTKFYRRECFEAISPVPPILGWDVIDEARARLRGWRTGSFADPGGDPLHTRPMGARDGRLRAFRRWGLCGYAYGAHPLHVVAYGGRLMSDRPYVAGGLNYLAGYAGGALQRAPRAEPELRRAVRQEQFGRMLGRVRRPAERS